jgi:uncharacterized membrane protein YidH (DUF202 family)
MLEGIWHYLDVARAIDDGTYRPSRVRIVVPSIIVVLIGGASLVWLLWREQALTYFLNSRPSHPLLRQR